MKENIYLQYGCGTSAPDRWANYDASPTLQFERLPLIGKLYTRNSSRFPKNIIYGNIVKGLPVAAECCSGVYCSHVLEHLSLLDFRVALENTHKILKTNGVFRLVVPDLEYFINKYVSNLSTEAAFDFLEGTSLGRKHRAKGFSEFIADWLGNSQHLWMWDFKSLEKELNIAGFENIRRACVGDSNDELFQLVENPARWRNCLGMECVKN